MPVKKFKAVIRAHPSGGAFVEVPFDVESVFGKKRVKILATFDGEPYRGLLARMGSPHHLLLVRKDIREKIRKGPGDEISVTVEEDKQPRIVTVPADLQRVLDDHPKESAFYSQLSFTHQREYIQWIEEAKKPETRARRIAKMVEMLGQKQRGR